MKRLFLTLTGWLLCLVLAAQSQYKIEYWFDGKYADHKTETTTSIWQTQMETSTLSVGFHTLNLHIQNVASGVWTSPQSFLFYRAGEASLPSDFNYTCWFDQDYTQTFTGSLDGSSLELPVSTLRDGFHILNVQIGEGSRAALQSFLFYKSADEIAPGDAEKYTCWFDQDYEHRISGSLINGSSLELSVSTLRDGFHTLNVQTGEGMDAALQSFLFYKVLVQDQEELGIEYFYWFNRDISHIEKGTFTDEDIVRELVNNNNLTNQQVDKIKMMLDASSLPNGIDTLNLLLKTGPYTLLTIDTFRKGPVTDTFATACVTFDWYGTTYTESGEYPHTFTDVSGQDSIVTLHLTVNSTTTGDTNAVVCNTSFDWYEYENLTESGNYTHTFTNAAGCDSVVTLHLTVNQFSNKAYTVESCGSYTWVDGNGETYGESGDYTYEYQDDYGCTHVDTLHLTIDTIPAVPTLTTTDNSSCVEPNGSITVSAPTGNYTYCLQGNENFQTETTFPGLSAGSYIVMVKDGNGCVSQKEASISTIGSNLSVTASAISPCEGGAIQLSATTQSEVMSFAWTGPSNFSSTDQNPTRSNATSDMNGDYTVVVTDALGCTAIGKTNVNVKLPSTGDTSATACGSFTWYETTYTSTPATAPTHTFTNAAGCDSVVTLHLTIHQPSEGDTTATACGSFTWYETTYTATPATAPTHTFTNAAGCDSVVTLHLTIYPEVQLSVTHSDQTKVFGEAIDDVVVTHSDYSDVTYSTLPNDLSYNSSMGILSGTPTAVGNYEVTFTATSTLTPPCGSELQQVVRITVTPKPVTLTANSANRKYDGSALTASGFTTTALETGDTHTFSVAMTPTSTITHYGTQPNVIAKVDGVDVQTGVAKVVGNYLVTTVEGTLSISKRTVRIETASGNQLYDGTALTNATYTITGDGFVDGEVSDIHTTGSVSDLSTCVDNGIEYTTTSAFNASNYQIDTVLGQLCITGSMATITVTSAGAPEEIIYDGQPHGNGSEFQHYTVTYDGENVNPDDETGLTFTLPTGDVLTVTPGFTGVTNVADENNTSHNNVFTYSITNADAYLGEKTITYGSVKLKKRDVTITVSPDYSTKTYDGSPLTVTYEHLIANGLVDGETLTGGYIVTDGSMPGEYTCTDNSFQYIMSMTASQHGIQVSSANSNYTPTFNVTLTIEPIVFDCPETKTFTLVEGTETISLTESELGEPTLNDNPLPSYVTASSNIADLNPLPAGVHTITWTLYGEDNTPLATCEQTVHVEYQPCEGTLENYGYYKRVGFQCWLTENLRVPVGDYYVYNEDMANLNKFGYLYSWYTAVGVTDDNTVPATYTADDGTLYVQGICPTGWAVPSASDVSKLSAAVGTTSLLKDSSTEYWLPGFQGLADGTGFNARGGGLYNVSMNRYEDLLTGFHFWESDAVQGSSSLFSACIAYYCDTVFVNRQSQKNDRMNVRCVRKNVTNQ